MGYVDTRSLDEYVEGLRRDRIARGLPPERPEDFVDIPLSVILADRLRPLERIVIRFLTLLADGVYPRIETANLEKYREDARLLSFSKSLHGSIVALGAKGVIGIIESVSKAVDSGMEDTLDAAALVRKGHVFLTFLRKDGIKTAYHHMELDLPENEKYIAFVEVVHKLRTDPEALEAEMAAAKEHYESIKHLI